MPAAATPMRRATRTPRATPTRPVTPTATRGTIILPTIMPRTITRMVILTTMATTITMTRIATTTMITVIPMLMTTNKPPAGDATTSPALDGDALNEGEAAALYRLMTWL